VCDEQPLYTVRAHILNTLYIPSNGMRLLGMPCAPVRTYGCVTVGIWCVCDVVTSMDTTRPRLAREANANLVPWLAFLGRPRAPAHTPPPRRV
jgi:hypothetical protein